MALQFQNVQVKMSSGLDTKDDPKSLQAKLLNLQNASFSSPGQLQKRDGFTGLTQSVQGGGSISNGMGLASYKNELVAMDGSYLYSYSPETNEQINKGSLIPVNLTVQPIARNSYQQNQPDSAYDPISKLQCFVWTETSDDPSAPLAPKYAIFDSTTDTQIASGNLDGMVQINGSKTLKVLSLGNYFIIFYSLNYQNSPTFNEGLAYYTIPTANPTATPTSVVLYSNVVSAQNPVFDACIINNSAYVVFATSSSQIEFVSISPTLVQSAPYLVTTPVNAAVLSIKGDASFNVWCSFSPSLVSTGLYTMVVNQALNATILAPTLVDTAPGSTNGFVNITMLISGATATIYYEAYTGLNETSNYLSWKTITITGTIGGLTGTLKGVGLASKAFTYNNANFVLVVYHGNYLLNNTGTAFVATTIEPTYFLIAFPNATPYQHVIIAKVAPSLAGPYYTQSILPEAVQINASEYSISYLIEENTVAVNGAIFSQTGFMQSYFNFAIPYPMSKQVMANTLNLNK